MGLHDGIGFTLEDFGQGTSCWEGSTDDLERLRDLFKQLPTDTKLLDHGRIRRLSKKPDFVLVVARDSEGHIVGMGNLTVKETPTRSSGYIDDVVVDLKFRGYGIDAAITKRLISIGKSWNLSHIDLTSNISRAAANELYGKLGFLKRNDETNYYRLEL